MAKAEKDGVYTLNGGRYFVRKGDALPEGAEFEAVEDAVAEQRARPAAPENRAEGNAPENRARSAKKADG